MKKISFVALILLFSMIISSCGLINPGGSDPTTTTEAPYEGEYEIRLTAIGSCGATVAALCSQFIACTKS